MKPWFAWVNIIANRYRLYSSLCALGHIVLWGIDPASRYGYYSPLRQNLGLVEAKNFVLYMGTWGRGSQWCNRLR
jgi:hypothetical protein